MESRDSFVGGSSYPPCRWFKNVSSRPFFEKFRHLAAGTLYGALTSLCEKGWIRPLPAESGSRKKEYQLTAEGVQVLKHELARLQQLVANGESILKEETL